MDNSNWNIRGSKTDSSRIKKILKNYIASQSKWEKALLDAMRKTPSEIILLKGISAEQWEKMSTKERADLLAGGHPDIEKIEIS